MRLARAIAFAMTFIIFVSAPSPSPLPQGARRIGDTFLFSLGYALNSDTFRFVKEEIEERSKGIEKFP